MSRILGEVREERDCGSRVSRRPPGRPANPKPRKDAVIESDRGLHAYGFLVEKWGRYNCEPCPVASQYNLVINVTNVKDVSSALDAWCANIADADLGVRRVRAFLQVLPSVRY